MTPRIGELNGRWALLFKITVVLTPAVFSLFTVIFMPWAIWVTDAAYGAAAQQQTVNYLSEECAKIKVTIEHLPPEEWKVRIRNLEEDAKQNFKDHSQILISLELIKAAVGVEPPTHEPGTP